MNQFLVIHGNTALSLFERDASSSAMRVFMTLCLYANIHDNTCFPSIGTICGVSKVGERTAREALDWLVANGFIEREKTFDPSGRQTSNTYTVFNKGAADCTGVGAVDRSDPTAVDCTPVKSTNKGREIYLNKKPLYPLEKGKRPVLELPDNLESHREAIEEWLAYKREKGQTYKPRGLAKLFKDLSMMANPTAAIEKSMACNYAGVFDKGVKPAKESFEDKAKRLGLA